MGVFTWSKYMVIWVEYLMVTVLVKFDTPLCQLHGETCASIHPFFWRRHSPRVSSRRWLLEKTTGNMLDYTLIAIEMTYWSTHRVFLGQFDWGVGVFLWHWGYTWEFSSVLQDWARRKANSAEHSALSVTASFQTHCIKSKQASKRHLWHMRVRSSIG